MSRDTILNPNEDLNLSLTQYTGDPLAGGESYTETVTIKRGANAVNFDVDEDWYLLLSIGGNNSQFEINKDNNILPWEIDLSFPETTI